MVSRCSVSLVSRISAVVCQGFNTNIGSECNPGSNYHNSQNKSFKADVALIIDIGSTSAWYFGTFCFFNIVYFFLANCSSDLVVSMETLMLRAVKSQKCVQTHKSVRCSSLLIT